ncbi:tRNA (adenosine(37)-N6)-threonylcarbamoyltransferase complex ATPase subunit type 1 TsaE [Undibacterium curvum]|uniref:tRNA threonylcarbamoyladenosine biosynthesis protein TsaE n=1 Tax=Undibacterium curvum TaxID=2762294 RepID=A0ABR7A8S0_9BURK|nr:tRNA (adenosine(37)-N6)-threonylcarbamoyltransferase complex ATPase subunit type 1 TsaE [Undibacterium curvum]MBC3933219.1 tRNA (adenosine(37)-N6)-threonylcarbamoyltransferase complex ATPase subunit type 1 TsaE [Undibacterium curvum]
MSHYKTTLHDEAATQALGKSLAQVLQPGMLVFLHGDLGAGKTALTRALIHAAGHQGSVKSPTYTLAEPYAVHLHGQPATIMHFDLYRMGSPEEFIDAGFREELNAQTLCLIEWPEKAAGVLPEADLHVHLSVAGDGREVELHALSAKGIACLASLHFAPNL